MCGRARPPERRRGGLSIIDSETYDFYNKNEIRLVKLKCNPKLQPNKKQTIANRNNLVIIFTAQTIVNRYQEKWKI